MTIPADCQFTQYGPGGTRTPCRRAATWGADALFGTMYVCAAHRKLLEREMRYSVRWFPLFKGCCPSASSKSRKASGRRSRSAL